MVSSKSIFSTLAYFSLFDYPLTLTELRRWLLRPFGVLGGGVERSTTLERPPTLVEYLKYVQSISDVRAAAYRATQHKLRRARRAAKIFKFFPFVRFVGVVNRVSWGVAHENSDIDFFIVARQERLWLARMLITGFAALFGMRPTSEHVANQLCLSFYLSDANLDIGNLRFQDYDVHFAFWLAQLLPLYDENNVYREIMDANRWWLNLFFYKLPGECSYAQKGKPFLKSVFERLLKGSVGDFFERLSRRYQLSLLNDKLAKYNLPYTSAVVFNNNVIKLHWQDRRKEYFEQWTSHLIVSSE